VHRQYSNSKRHERDERRGLAVRQRGASCFEFLLQSVLLISLILVIVDLCALVWVSISMQSAMQAALASPAPGTERVPAMLMARIKQHSHGLYDKLSPSYSVKLHGVSTVYNSPASYRPGMFGKTQEPVEIELDCSWPLLTPLVSPFFPDGQYRFSVVQSIGSH
jgi:hypothetical protein